MGDILVKPWFEKATTSTGTLCHHDDTRNIARWWFQPIWKRSSQRSNLHSFSGWKVAFYTWNHPPRSVLIVSHDSQMVTRHWHLKSSAPWALLRDPISILFAWLIGTLGLELPSMGQQVKNSHNPGFQFHPLKKVPCQKEMDVFQPLVFQGNMLLS